MPYSALSIANEFLKLGKKENIPISPMKIQKLLYLAQGYYLYIHEDSLVDESFEAWKFGPVLPSIYRTCKKFGRTGIHWPLYLADGDFSPYPPPEPKDGDVSKVIESVWKHYGKYDPMLLSKWTHEDEGPWSRTLKEQGRFANIIRKNIPISNEYIKEYFTKALDSVKK